MKKMVLILIMLLFLPLTVFAASPSTVTYDTKGATSVPSQTAYNSFVSKYQYFYYFKNSSSQLWIAGSVNPITANGDSISSTSTIYSVAYNDYVASNGTSMNMTGLTHGHYTVVPPDTVKPVITSSLAEGTYTSAQQVTLSSDEPATIYYSLDGVTPTTTSTVYSNPIMIDSTVTLKYFGKDTAGNSSDVVTVTYTIDIPPDRDGDGISDGEDLYPDDPTNTPPAYDETSEAEGNKMQRTILMVIAGLIMTSLVLGRGLL